MRTVAIYLVVLFHAGIGWMTGGFIGVDVFFVLSGFLVTNIILAEHDRSGRVRLGRFYSRRIRRLLPAALVTIFVVSALSLLVLPRLARANFVGDARAALLYVANFHFLGQATDYFASDVQQSPFLHFWSLSIEEQFYVVFPALMIGLLWLAKRWRRAIVVPATLVVLCAASVIAQVLRADHDSLRAYYGTDTRLYQLLAGAALAATWHQLRQRGDARVRRMPDPRAVAALAIVSIVGLIVLATDWIDLDPSGRGLMATALTVLLIVSLELGTAGDPGRRVLATRPMAYLGRISYGTYLWHWPLIVLARPVVDIGSTQTAVYAVVAATALSAISARLLEMPIRRAPALTARPRATIAAGLSMSVLVAVLAVPPVLESSAHPVLTDRSVLQPSGDLVPVAGLEDALHATAPSDLDADVEASVPPVFDWAACTGQRPDSCIVHAGRTFTVLIIGDSNAEMLIHPLEALAEQYDFTLAAAVTPGCPWQEGLLWNGIDAMVDRCSEDRRAWYDSVVPGLDPDIVIAAAVPRDANSRTDGSVFEPESGSLGGQSIDDVAAAATDASLDALSAEGARVVLFEPLPFGDFDPTICLSGASDVGQCAYEVPATTFPTETTYRKEADERPDAVFDVDYDRIACPYLPVCLPVVDGRLVFRNQYHLGNEWLMDHRDELWDLVIASGALDGLV